MLSKKTPNGGLIDSKKHPHLIGYCSVILIPRFPYLHKKYRNIQQCVDPTFMSTIFFPNISEQYNEIW